MKITDIHKRWRDNWRQASFRGVPFLVDVGGKGSGRRTVLHQFPKRNTPYAEDLGREAYAFSVTGYLIDGMAPAFNFTDYTDWRDALEAALEDVANVGPGILILPTRGQNYNVTCVRYNCMERRTEGGFVQFDMVFVEYGESPKPLAGNVLPSQQVAQTADAAAMAGAQGFNQQTGVPFPSIGGLPTTGPMSQTQTGTVTIEDPFLTPGGNQ
jgi:prophage DNA circulation protein